MKSRTQEHRDKLSAALKGRRPSDACLKAAADAHRAKSSQKERMAKVRAAKIDRVPTWIRDEGLRAEFRQILHETRDEFAACRHIRSLLREMRT